MLKYPNINPVAVDLGVWQLPFNGAIHPQVHWYGVMYLIAFVSCFCLLKHRSKSINLLPPVKPEQINDLLFYIALGTVLGGRIGYMVFYNFPALLENPLSLFKVWQGGMSFHGGLLGVLVAVWLYGKKLGATFVQMTDFIAPGIPLGLMAGRIGNFINAELWGRVTDLPWGVVFPNGGPLPRHPSMLYEALLEGLVLFLIVWFYSAKPRPRMAVSAVFAIFYGTFRIAVEFVRQPDDHIGYLAFGWVTMGMLLSLPMIAIGLTFVYLICKRQKNGA